MWDSYGQLAAQYYVTGRFAAQAGYVPLCGNMFHHAIELLLKCGLVKSGTLGTGTNVDDVLRKKYNHRLLDLWADFKHAYPGADVRPFDALIASLDRWENIRYPKRGVAMSISRAPGTQPVNPPGPGAAQVATFSLSVPDVDQCFQQLWQVISLSAEWFEIVINAQMHQLPASVYSDDNHYLVYA